MSKEQAEEKATVTNIAVTLGKGRFKIFQSGVNAYQSGYDKPAKEIRAIHNKVGKALNLIYVDLAEAGMKRDEIAKTVEQYFPNMSTSIRSKYKKFANNFQVIEQNVISKNPSLYSLQKIINKFEVYTTNFKKAQNEADNLYNIDFGQFVEKEEVFTKDEKGKVIPLSKKEIPVTEQLTKKHIDAPIAKGVSEKDLRDHVIRLCAEVEKRYKVGKFSGTLEKGGYVDDIESVIDRLSIVLKDKNLMNKLEKDYPYVDEKVSIAV